VSVHSTIEFGENEPGFYNPAGGSCKKLSLSRGGPTVYACFIPCQNRHYAYNEKYLKLLVRMELFVYRLEEKATMNSGSQCRRSALLLLIVAVIGAGVCRVDAANTVVKFVVHAGPVDPNDPDDPNMRSFYVRMGYDDAHDTVANFLRYVNDGIYDNSIFHRLHFEPTLEVLQGGGISYNSTTGFYYIPRYDPIDDDYDRPNVRGTIAMAKTSAPNSATNGFYFNLQDFNAGTLAPNPLSNGYMVFGYVIGDGMDAVDDLAGYGANPLGVDIQDHGAPLDDLPLIPSGGYLYFEWLQSVSVVGVDGDTDFDGDVDLDDFNLFSASFGQRGIGLAADFDGDYDVDMDDFTVLRTNYGDPASAPSFPGGTVPEPGSICLLCLCGMAMISRRRRKS